MNEETLPPSPNWYLSNVLTCLDEHTIAYGARNNIVVAKYVPENSMRTPEVSVISNAHKERVTVISCSHATSADGTFWHCLASAGDDSVLKVWNWDSLTPLLAHNSHTEGVKISAMDWSNVDSNLIVSGDEQGTIVCWDLFSNTTQRLNFGKLVPTCLSCCPHKRELIAVGTRSGLVCTITLKGGGKMLHRLRGHDTEVVSLSWCPVPYNVLQSKKSKEDMLLASGAKEKTIYIWRAGGDGRYETVIHLPTVPLAQEAPGSQKHRSRLGGNAAVGATGGVAWTCVSWPEPNTLLSSTLFGELASCSLKQVSSLKSSKGASGTKLWKLVHSCHTRGLFSIAYVPNIASVSDQQAEEKMLLNGNEISENRESESEAKEVETFENTEHLQVVWTAAQDRQMVVCYWKTGTLLTEFSTLGGFVYCIATSPLDSNRIAFGVGDGTIRVWNLSNSTSVDITTLWQKIKGKVMALAWHPTKESWLAYGTSEGRVGLYDVSCGKLPILLHPYHRRSVYTLCWGPPVCKTGDVATGSNYLYSCGDGDIIRYDPENPNEEPYNLKTILQNPDISSQKNTQRSDIAWKPDNSLLAVGNEDGTVNILAAPHLKLLHTLFGHKKLIQCLAWHPESTATDASYSPYQHWLAVGSNETDIKVYDLSPLCQGGDVETNQLKHIENCITLSGHLCRIVSMCWSPHISGHLVSVSYDNTAQLWNVPAQQPIANYCGHNCNVYSCAWSPLDPDLVITGAADFTLRVWKISKQTQVLPSERKKLKKLETKKMASVLTATVSSTVRTAKQPHHKEGDKKSDESKLPDEDENNAVEFAKSEKEACEVSVSQNMKKKKMSARKSFFPVSSHHLNQGKVQHLSNCYHLLKALDRNTTAVNNEDGIEKGEIPPYFGFFGDRDSMQKLLDMEAEHHISAGNIEMAHHIELWKGNITDMLKEAARQRQLNDWLVSLAPMASQRLWMEICKSYSEQLTVCGQYQKAASYLLVCHKVYEAIDLLVTYHLYREALSIARCRLLPDDPTVKTIVSAWARHAALEGNYELAVECLISIGELMEAAMLIRKRSDEGSLKLAALIASKAGAEELAGMLACQSLKQSLLVGNWAVANEVVSHHQQLKHLKLMVAVHQTVMELSAAKLSCCAQWLGHVAAVSDTPLFEMISSRFESEKGEDGKQEMYGLLLKDFRKNDSPDSVEKMWLAVSVEVALSFTSVGAKQLHHLVAALNICYQYNQLQPTVSENFVLQFCMWLAPRGPFSDDSIFYSDMSEESRFIMRSMRAYLCVGVVDWMMEYISSDEAKNVTEEENGIDCEPEQCVKCSSVWCSFAELLNRCMNDILTKESLQYFQDCVKIKKWEHEIASAVAKSKKGEPMNDGSGDGVPRASTPDNATETDDVLHKLELLKQRKQEFETTFNTTPNPFVMYCKIKNLVVQNESENYKTLGVLLENLWRDIAIQL